MRGEDIIIGDTENSKQAIVYFGAALKPHALQNTRFMLIKVRFKWWLSSTPSSLSSLLFLFFFYVSVSSSSSYRCRTRVAKNRMQTMTSAKQCVYSREISILFTFKSGIYLWVTDTQNKTRSKTIKKNIELQEIFDTDLVIFLNCP